MARKDMLIFFQVRCFWSRRLHIRLQASHLLPDVDNGGDPVLRRRHDLCDAGLHGHLGGGLVQEGGEEMVRLRLHLGEHVAPGL